MENERKWVPGGSRGLRPSSRLPPTPLLTAIEHFGVVAGDDAVQFPVENQHRGNNRAAPSLPLPGLQRFPQAADGLHLLHIERGEGGDLSTEERGGAGWEAREVGAGPRRDRNLDVDAAVNKLARYLAWRADVRPHELTADDVAAEAATGKAYLHPFPDAAGRPAVVIRCAKHVIGAAPLRKSVELASTVLDAAVASLPPDSETLVGIFDLRGFGPRNADLAFARFLVDACFLYYPRRLGAVLFVDAPWAFKPVWAVVRPLLKKYAALVAFVSADDVVASFKPGEAPADFARSKL